MSESDDIQASECAKSAEDTRGTKRHSEKKTEKVRY